MQTKIVNRPTTQKLLPPLIPLRIVLILLLQYNDDDDDDGGGDDDDDDNNKNNNKSVQSNLGTGPRRGSCARRWLA